MGGERSGDARADRQFELVISYVEQKNDRFAQMTLKEKMEREME